MEFETLVDLSRDATLEASKSLSRFVRAPVSVGTVRAEILGNCEITLAGNPAELIYPISSTITGNSSGLAVVCLPMAMACELSDLLFRRAVGTTRSIAAEDEDALSEMGNIVIGSYLRSFARSLPGTTLVHRMKRVPRCTRAELTSHLTGAWQAGSHETLLFQVSFNFRHAEVDGIVLIMMEVDRVRALVEQALSS